MRTPHPQRWREGNEHLRDDPDRERWASGTTPTPAMARAWEEGWRAGHDYADAFQVRDWGTVEATGRGANPYKEGE